MLEPRRLTSLCLAFGVLALGVPGLAAGAGEQTDGERTIAVIVHKSNQIDRIDLAELRKIFTLERQSWSDGGKIHALVQEPGSFEEEIMLSKVHRMSESELRKLWVEKTADNVARPRAASSAAIKRAVARDTRAIGIIDATLRDGTVKVLRVNGLPPESPVYPLKEKVP